MIAAVLRPFLGAHRALWMVVWPVTLALMVIVEATTALHRRPDAEHHDAGSRLAIALGIGGGILGLVLSERIGGWSVIRPPVVAFALGEALCVAGAGLRAWAMHSLGALFTRTVRTSPDQPVIDSGPYRLVRHPSYTALLMFLIGAGLVVGNWVGLVAIAAGSALGLGYRIRVEEAALTAALGERYRAYAAPRKRLIPGVW